jgi:IMP dehydrogenase
MKEHNISGLPITQKGHLKGILTHRDIRFVTNIDQTVSAVMTKENLITAPEGTTLAQAEAILQNHRIEKLPVVDKDFKLKGLVTVKDIQMRKEYPNACKDDLGRLRVGAAIGVGPKEQQRAQALVEAQVDFLIVDSAHGHSEGVINMVQWVRKKFPQVNLIGGNVGTEEGAKALIEAGVDGVKVGIGPGSICTTRMVSGVGVPQWSALYHVCKVAQKNGIPVISDGGIKFSGDLVKALAIGANSIMIGSLFAGTDEAPGEVVLYQGRSYKVYRGMGSIEAMKEGSRDRYGQGDSTPLNKLVPEGIVGRVPYKGSVANSIYQLVGGLRSGMGYLGAKNILEMQKKAKFVRITASGLRESHAHDVIITKEAPNYVIE